MEGIVYDLQSAPGKLQSAIAMEAGVLINCQFGARASRMSGCQPDSARGLPACPLPSRQAGSLAAESAKLADIQFRLFQ
jgi:hypothetical protein